MFEGQGKVARYVGGYTDWMRQGGTLAVVDRPPGSASQPKCNDGSNDGNVNNSLNTSLDAARKPERRKLSYKDQRELNALPDEIHALEEDIARLHQETAAPDFYTQSSDIVSERLQHLATTERLLDEKMARWLELDG